MVFMVAALATSLSWVYGGSRGDLLLSFVPWLSFLVLEGLFCFPQCHEGESHVHARERTWRSLRRDPLTWVSLAFVLLLLVPFVNKGLCQTCDYPEIMAGANPNPPNPNLPFCVNRINHLNVVMWFVPSLLVLLAVRHALTKHGKLMLLELLVWNGVALGLLGFIQLATGANGPLWSAGYESTEYFFSTFGYVNMGGDYFTVLFVLSLAVWSHRFDEARAESAEEDGPDRSNAWIRFVRAFRDRHYLLIASMILFITSYNTRSRAAVMLTTAAAALVLLRISIVALAQMSAVQRFRTVTVAATMLVAMFVGGYIAMPLSVREEIRQTSVNSIFSRLTGRSEYHFSVAADILSEHKLFGVGGWGYSHFSAPKTPKSVSQYFRYSWARGGSNVHNDYLQFMTEHGLVGFGLMAAIFLLALWPTFLVWMSMARSIRFVKQLDLPSPRGLFIFPAGAFATLVALLCTLIHALADCPLRSPSVLMLFCIELTAIDGFLPLVRPTTKED